MFLKAVLICEDLRFELGGTRTLVGVHGERLVGMRMGQRIGFAQLMFVTVVGGLAGGEVVQFRQSLRALDAEHASRDDGWREEPHDPTADEHTLVFGNTPMTFPAPGRYEITTEIDSRSGSAIYRYAFDVVGADPG